MVGRAFSARFDFARRHLALALPYLTPRKVANLALNEIELRLGRSRLRSLPPFIKLESTPICHLSCTGCLHSDVAFKKSLGNKKHLTLETTKEALQGLETSLIGASLSYTGEPLLNQHLIPIIQHLNHSGFYTSFPTNLSVPLSEEKAIALVSSGLDLIMVSLDGTSRESYSRFRKGGNFELVQRNVELIAAVKRRLNRRRPYLLWKFIIFDHNRHEVVEARKSWKKLGFNGIEFDVDHDSEAYRTGSRAAASHIRPCFWVWNTATIAWDGDMQPCCKQMGKISIGNASASLRRSWNNEAYQTLRNSFTQKDGASLNTVCRSCLGLDPVHDDSLAEAAG